MTVADIIKNKDYDYIEWRVIFPYDDSDMFFGATQSKDGKLIPLDYDSYYEETEIISYEEWSELDKGIKNGLTIVYKGEWFESD